MQRLEQEIKELQSGLGAVVQALTFLQNFLESDYGLKFQFHAYCNAYSHNSNILEALKQKYGSSSTTPENSAYANNQRVYHHQSQSQPTGTGDPQLVHVRFQGPEPEQGIQPTVNVISSCAVGSCSTQSLGQTFVTVTNTGDISTTHQQQSESVTDALNQGTQRTPIIVNEDDIHIFGISELTSMKEEAHEIYHNEAEMDTFTKQDFDDNSESNDDEVSSNIQSPDVSVESKKIADEPSPNPGTVKRGRTKKEKLNDGFKCPHCRRRCADRVKLELHMSHHKQQIQCSTCGIWLADKSVLNRHMRIHNGDRPFRCSFCNETFARQDIAKKHILRKHKGLIDNGNLMSGIKCSKPAASSTSTS